MSTYGYTPFPFFKMILIVSIILLLYYSKQINAFFKRKEDKDTPVSKYYYLAVLIPLFIICYYDAMYSTFSLHSLGVSDENHRKMFDYVFKCLGAYGIIQVLAQDIGVKTGEKQRDLIQLPVMQFLIFFGTAYSITDDRSEALMGVFLYFLLKYNVSGNKTSDVCFEDV